MTTWGTPTSADMPVSGDMPVWDLLIVGDVPATSRLTFLVIHIKLLPDKYPRGQLVHQQWYMGSGKKQNRESTERYSKSTVRQNNDKFGKGLVSTSRTHASPKGTGPGVRRSKRPLSACHTRRKCSMLTTQNSVKGRVRYKV